MSRFEKLNGGQHVPLVMTDEEKKQAEEVERLTAQAFTLVCTSLADCDPFTATSVAVMTAGALIRRAEKLGLDQTAMARCMSTGMKLVDESAARGRIAQSESRSRSPSDEDEEC